MLVPLVSNQLHTYLKTWPLPPTPPPPKLYWKSLLNKVTALNRQHVEKNNSNNSKDGQTDDQADSKPGWLYRSIHITLDMKTKKAERSHTIHKSVSTTSWFTWNVTVPFTWHSPSPQLKRFEHIQTMQSGTWIAQCFGPATLSDTASPVQPSSESPVKGIFPWG